MIRVFIHTHVLASCCLCARILLAFVTPKKGKKREGEQRNKETKVYKFDMRCLFINFQSIVT